MMNLMTEQRERIEVGDQVLIIDNIVLRGDRDMPAEVIEIRRILGEQVYVVMTEAGERKLVKVSQVSKAESLKGK